MSEQINNIRPETFTEFLKAIRDGGWSSISYTELKPILRKELSYILEMFTTIPLGFDHSFPDIFGKYGYTYAGIYEGFIWNDESLENVSEYDMWRMIAISNTYWVVELEKWNHELKKKIYEMEQNESVTENKNEPDKRERTMED